MHNFANAAAVGYLEAPKKVPARGVLMGVAERYDMVCDFSKFANQQLYMWNGRNEDVMKDVPMFCYSHLLSRLEIGGESWQRESWRREC